MITEETLTVLDEIEALSDKILESRLYQAYREAEQALADNDEAHLLYQAFLKSKDKYDEIMRFGKYHPDYQNVMLDTRKRKRAYEMLPVVMDHKQKEVALQELIDQVIVKIAYAVSENVKIEAGNPFFQKDAGGCATGGSCSCSL
ncbi:YlbF/YmcA family competence regulator [Staphylococcus pseudoxylosus]|uniref:YlbF family regulator n=1 Tax=Staphylococcus pseudoxylosus TaxID=2282419 RepID=A0AAQ0S6K8_9STAP|nr:YlbF family regulator [Staphylococcus pseudoxylosus]MBM2658760.1 YlbF family regulator [Staphylococcus pseudoxylosus]MCE5003023.1 YlbF family regulator [Staphylococcus pseudoxylosus]MEB6169750.1 YlbF family regulator [Staphylococcus pseudoxylosus]RMI84898.1 YlbF family regulator [Staphylococcus pseudoxylosus]